MSLKEKLYQYIEKGDERLLNLMYAVAKEYNEEENIYELTNEEIEELNRRREKRISGESMTYTWEQAKTIISL